ncbi:MAG: DegT/DnrJ/EryC1/StrS family aminotransferase [Desulfobacteraceae bacterium]|nr:DegT/DnrJ/EryC1/StrS family aminotransferase [Desulfobacteraceae bacterium]
MKTLALLGGPKAVTLPLKSSVVIDDDERRLVNEVLDRGELSRFMGSPTPGIEDVLVMPSAAAENYSPQYFTFLGGRMVRRFEAEAARYFGVKYMVSANSATSCLSMALAAAGIGPGDEVITTCMSFNATAMSVLMFNSIPVFVDVSADNFCLDPEAVARAITPRTKAILVVHLLGFPADMEAIMAIADRRRLVVIEDCAQAPGTKSNGRYVGTIGQAGVFSLQETKNFQTGEGGLLATNDPAIARKARLIRNHGESVPDASWDDEDLANVVGFNFRMTELTAAFGVGQMGKLSENNRVRADNARYLTKALAAIPGLRPVPFKPDWVPHILPMLYDAEATGVPRALVLRALREEGVPVGSGYTRLMHENPLFVRQVAYGRHGCPWKCAGEGYTAPAYPCPTAEDLLRHRFIWFYHINRPNGLAEMEQVVEAFLKVFSSLEELKNCPQGEVALGYKW